MDLGHSVVGGFVFVFLAFFKTYDSNAEFSVWKKGELEKLTAHIEVEFASGYQNNEFSEG